MEKSHLSNNFPLKILNSVNYEIAECQRCKFLFQKNILNYYYNNKYYNDYINQKKAISKSYNTKLNPNIYFNEIQMLRLKNSETILITSAYHMKRSIIIANKKGLNFFPYAIDFKTKDSNSLINSYRAFNIVDNLKKFNLFFREIFGITVFKIFF